METLSIFLPVITLLPTLVFFFKIFSKSIQSWTRSANHSPLPPGRTGWPVIGETLEFVSHTWKGTPEKFFHERIRKYESSTFKTSFLGNKTMVLYGAEGNKFLFANEEKLVRNWLLLTVRKLLVVLDTGNKLEIARVRNLMQSFLKPDIINKYVGIMDSIAQSHFQAKWHTTNQASLLSFYSLQLIEEFGGLMIRAVNGFFSLPINLPWTQFGQAIKASKVIKSRLTTILRNKRHELALAIEKDFNYKDIASNQDIVSHRLVHADESGTCMSDRDIAEWTFGLLIAGHETTSVVISTIFKYLGENPEIYHKVFQEQMEIARNKMKGELLNYHDICKIKYSWNVAKEAMRICPPAIAVYREAISDFIYSGYHIPKGSKLHLSIYATHKDEKYFPNPENFDPSRFEKDGPLPYTFVPFGGGPRMCPGKNYAQFEILVFLHNAVKRFKWENIFPDEEIILYPFPRPSKGLPIHLHPHQTNNF